MLLCHKIWIIFNNEMKNPIPVECSLSGPVFAFGSGLTVLRSLSKKDLTVILDALGFSRVF